MDTNLVQVLVTMLLQQQMLSQKSGVVATHDPGLSNLLIAGLLMLAAVAPTLVSLASYWQAKATKVDTGLLKISSAEVAVNMDKVHTAVNGERVTLLAHIDSLREEVLKLSADKATMVEHQRGTELATQVKDAKDAKTS